MLETFTQVHTFCRLVGHYQCFIKGFTYIVRSLYDVLGKEVKMGLVQLPPEAQEAVRILKDKIQSAPMLVFPDFDKPFLLDIVTSKEGLGKLGNQVDMEEGCALFRIHNSLVLSKGLLYISTTPKGEVEGVLAFLIPSSQHTAALNGVHYDVGHQGQQRTLALAEEHFWWPMLAVDCKALVRGCLRCRAFEGAVPKAPLCPIRTHAPLELVHVDFTSVESTMELNKPPSIKNILVIMDHFTRYALAVVTKDQMAKTIAKVFYKRFIMVFSTPALMCLLWSHLPVWPLWLESHYQFLRSWNCPQHLTLQPHCWILWFPHHGLPPGQLHLQSHHHCQSLHCQSFGHLSLPHPQRLCHRNQPHLLHWSPCPLGMLSGCHHCLHHLQKILV